MCAVTCTVCAVYYTACAEPTLPSSQHTFTVKKMELP